MNKRQLRKKAHESIVKNSVSHQVTFDTLKKEVNIGPGKLADLLVNIPSTYKSKKHKTLITIYLISLNIIVLMKLIEIVFLFGQDTKISFIILMTLIGVALPVYGIVSAINGRLMSYNIVALLLASSFFRTFSFTVDLSNIIVLLPFITAIVLGLYLPIKA